MKRLKKLAVLALVWVLGSSLLLPLQAQYAGNYDRDREVTYQDFYDQLSPYGKWVDHPDYGYVWIPDAGPDFQPYQTEGHWVWTEEAEWMWVSGYDWGWAPFHYGRWDQDDYYGWFWVPGYEWSPAWVAWRDGGDYYGWAPLRPGVNIDVNFNIGTYAPPHHFWSFTPRRYILYPRIREYCVDYHRNYSIISVTTVINFNIGGRWGFRSGPRRWEAERYCGPIRPVRFRDSYSPGRVYYRDNEIRMYRPNVRREEGRGFAPRQFERYERNNNFRQNNGNGRPDNGNRSNNGWRPERNGNNGNNNGWGRNENGNRSNRDNDRIAGNRTGRPDTRDRITERPAPPRSFERRESRNGYNQPQSHPQPQSQSRSFERREPRNGYSQPRSQPQPRSFERRESRNGYAQPQSRPQPQSQPRSFERRSENNSPGNREFRQQGNRRG